jgi:multiple sugar transport system permease protein
VKKTAYTFLFPAFLLFFCILIIPFLITFYHSFIDYDLSNPASQGEFLGLNNYHQILKEDELFDVSFLNTSKFIVIGIFFETIIGFFLAFLLYKIHPSTRRFFVSMIIIPMMLAPVTVGLIWLFLLNTDYGIISFFLKKLNLLVNHPILGSPETAFWAVRAVDLWEWTPFMTLMFLSGFTSLPKAPLEAAELDNLSGWVKLRYLYIPMLKPIFFIALFIRVIETFKTFDIVYILTGGGPGTTTEMVSTYAHRIIFEYQRYGYGGAHLIILVYVTILLCVLFFNFSKSWQKQSQ